MNKQDLAEIKEKLLAEKINLETELDKIAKKNPHNPNDYEAQFENVGDDEEDSTSEVVEYGLNLTLEKTLEKSLKDVKKSLERIEKGDYGVCKYCKQEIDPKRLKARPTSSACIACKTKLKSM
ncbi:MAG: Transcriptional regulator, TraR/DksA family [Parcubacteria group bacterium GW2011_GWC2_39_14]|nr:MAG: Transcriptional regulator, TraR/DksA family [Parcubacteria group bacterium GW2011_GWC2_39_14]KKR53232.1 MAG: Transcriptional regulator, TraR/DksA family [Parcubacteria group bacterium GW2011_GWA2_40_23]